MQASSLLEVCPELLSRVLENLDHRSLCRVASCCHDLSTSAKEDSLWAPRWEAAFGARPNVDRDVAKAFRQRIVAGRLSTRLPTRRPQCLLSSPYTHDLVPRTLTRFCGVDLDRSPFGLVRASSLVELEVEGLERLELPRGRSGGPSSTPPTPPQSVLLLASRLRCVGMGLYSTS